MKDQKGAEDSFAGEMNDERHVIAQYGVMCEERTL